MARGATCLHSASPFPHLAVPGAETPTPQEGTRRGRTARAALQRCLSGWQDRGGSLHLNQQEPVSPFTHPPPGGSADPRARVRSRTVYALGDMQRRIHHPRNGAYRLPCRARVPVALRPCPPGTGSRSANTPTSEVRDGCSFDVCPAFQLLRRRDLKSCRHVDIGRARRRLPVSGADLHELEERVRSEEHTSELQSRENL